MRRRPKNRVTPAAELRALGFVERSPWHWQARIFGRPIDYWPTRNKWSYAGEIETGSPQELIDAMKVMRANEARNPDGVYS